MRLLWFSRLSFHAAVDRGVVAILKGPILAVEYLIFAQDAVPSLPCRSRSNVSPARRDDFCSSSLANIFDWPEPY